MVISSNALSHYYKLNTVFTFTLPQGRCRLKLKIRDKSHYPGCQQQAKDLRKNSLLCLRSFTMVRKKVHLIWKSAMFVNMLSKAEVGSLFFIFSIKAFGELYHEGDAQYRRASLHCEVLLILRATTSANNISVIIMWYIPYIIH